MSVEWVLLFLASTVFLVDVVVFRLGFPMEKKHFRLFRFLMWYSAVSLALLILFLILWAVFAQNLDGLTGKKIWDTIVPIHSFFSLFYAVYLEWFSDYFRSRSNS
ncbi:hypothetical protein RUE5091_02420 [Ruegeria denitrificans]|uniref:Uncharacterized protein n=1 Tax=Ruegeria denitrificans TaxID=1715692 RepID=A0A0P1IBB5_9RHOB|nr:hypothetical protein RUE5091_02420 [Ruegeria denitrificans]